MKFAEAYAEYATLRQVDYQRVSTGALQEFAEKLLTLEQGIAGHVRLINESQDLARRIQVELIVRDIHALIDAVFAEMAERWEEILDEVNEAQAEDARHWLLWFTGNAVTAGAITRADKLLLLGATVREHFERSATAAKFIVGSRVMAGAITDGQSGEALAKSLSGQGEDARALDSMAAQVTTIVRSSADAAVNQITQDVVKAAAPEGELKKKATVLHMGWQQISVLDARTTDTCRRYASKIWNWDYEPVGHNLPYDGGVPRHLNCRSSIIPIALDEDPMANLTFAKWMAEKTRAEQDAIFGKSAAGLWRAGKITDSTLMRQEDNPLSPELFKEKLRQEQDARMRGA